MPRIDDALARARLYRPEESVPVSAGGEDGAHFPVEAEEPLPAVAVPEGLPIPDPAAASPRVDSVFAATAVEDARAGEVALTQGTLDAAQLQGEVVPDEKLLSPSVEMTSVEQYRRLAARLYLTQSQEKTRIVMVTSALPGEGKTLTAANLALTLSESYRRQVLLIDADLRRPSLHELFQVPNVTGLNEGLRASVDRKVPVIRITDHLTILTAGRPEPDPMSVLASDRMRRVLEEAGENFEWVIVDTPPIGLLSDGRLLTSLVDTVLLVVRAGSTPTSAIEHAVEAIGRDRILGVVLNRADEAMPHVDYAYQYYASPRTQQ
jgi:protein-tyrosine kinase